MMKAIKITKDNKSKLEAQYNMEQGYLELSSGLYVVAGFGDRLFEILSKSQLDTYYMTGNKIENDYVEVHPIAGYAGVPNLG
jgi:hypothetical protein